MHLFKIRTLSTEQREQILWVQKIMQNMTIIKCKWILRPFCKQASAKRKRRRGEKIPIDWYYLGNTRPLTHANDRTRQPRGTCSGHNEKIRSHPRVSCGSQRRKWRTASRKNRFLKDTCNWNHFQNGSHRVWLILVMVNLLPLNKIAHEWIHKI